MPTTTPKKIAKKIPKKAAKKHASHHPGRDMRRAYEHISRVRILHLGLPPQALEHVDTLVRLAQGALQGEDPRTSADLLRAAEHFAFGSLAPATASDAPSRELIAAASAEYDALREHAKEHNAHRPKPLSSSLTALYKLMLANAAQAFAAGAFHRALEFARGAEALTHASPVAATRKLPASRNASMLHLR